MTAKFIPEVEAGIEIITEQIITEMGLPFDDPVLEAIIRKAYSAGWENGYEAETYPHNPDNQTCPGPGIKCVCWDIEQAAKGREVSQ